jgi:hypothetical protein
MKKVVWGVKPCGSSKNQRSGRTYRLHEQGEKNRGARNIVSSNLQPKHTSKKSISSQRASVASEVRTGVLCPRKRHSS